MLQKLAVKGVNILLGQPVYYVLCKVTFHARSSYHNIIVAIGARAISLE